MCHVSLQVVVRVTVTCRTEGTADLPGLPSLVIGVDQRTPGGGAVASVLGEGGGGGEEEEEGGGGEGAV